MTTTTILSQKVLAPVPGATVQFCNAPASGVPCVNKATTYTDATLGTPCATSTQVVLDGTNTCVAATDSLGNWGVWVAAGQYAYTFSTAAGNFGPFFATAPFSGAVSNANLPNPMNLTDTLTVTVGSGDALHLVNTGTNRFLQFSNTTYPSSTFGMQWQSPGFITLVPNNGSGNAQIVLGSKDFTFEPFTGLTGGRFSIGANGNEYQIGTDNGKLLKYNAVTVSGNGQAVIRNAIDQTAEVTGNSGTLTLVTPASSNSVYRLTIYTVVSTGVATSTIQWTASYTDVVGATTTVGTSINGAVTGTKLGESFIIEAQSGVAVTLATSTANSPKYKYYVRLEEL
jgi:hypothetical protein